MNTRLMRARFLAASLAIGGAVCCPLAAQAQNAVMSTKSAPSGNAETYAAAFKAATEVEDSAGKLHCQWTATEDTLKQARATANTKDYAAATKLATKAKALAELSIKQYHEQQTLWHNEVIH